MSKTLYIGLDVHKETLSVSVAEDRRNGEVRFIGVIPNTAYDIAKMAKQLSRSGQKLHFCYEAGCCGYVIYRQLIDLGHACLVAAPTKIPKKPGDRIKTDRRDSHNLGSGPIDFRWVA